MEMIIRQCRTGAMWLWERSDLAPLGSIHTLRELRRALVGLLCFALLAVFMLAGIDVILALLFALIRLVGGS